MASEQYTRCPHCKATFQVNENQLSAAGGKVRCGACMEVFDALAYLIGNEAATPTHPAATAPAENNHEQDIDDEDLVFEDSDEDKKEAAKNVFDESLLSDSFKDLDKTKRGQFESQDDLDDNIYTSSRDADDWAEKILDEPDVPSPATARTEPEIEPLRAEKEEPFFVDEQDNSARPETIDFYYEEPEMKPGRGAFSKFLIGTACFVLVLVLIAQGAWFHYERLAKYPIAKQAFETACKHIGCALPELADLNAIQSSNLVVRSHPLVAKTLIIDVVLTNEAVFEQDYPRMALYFSDINGTTVAQQIIPPEIYLNDPGLLSRPMPIEEPIHVSIEIEDPGKQAVNYKIRFFPNKARENSANS